MELPFTRRGTSRGSIITSQSKISVVYPAPVSTLTDRERSVALLVHKGHTNKEIGIELKISINVVKKLLIQIYDKMKIRTRTALALMHEMQQEDIMNQVTVKKEIA